MAHPITSNEDEKFFHSFIVFPFTIFSLHSFLRMSLFLYLILSFFKSFILIGLFYFFIFLLLYCKLCNDRLSDSSLNPNKDENSAVRSITCVASVSESS